MTLSEYIDILKDIELQGYGDKDVSKWKYSKSSNTLHLEDLNEEEVTYSKDDDLIIINN